MNERKLQRRCKRALRDLGIQPPLKVDVLCRLLGEHRGRPIRLIPYSLPVPGPFGLWIATGTADYVLYQKETSPAHQDHIILHEVGHILADHQSDDSYGEVWRQTMPDISLDVIKKALRRTSYDEDREREAELVATIILEWASVLDRVTPQAPEDASAHRVQTALSDRQGWL
ncbi:hypothetical protein [Streptomyces sp. 8N706]|uniref:hypothetical protein n=1 Tax=Streptomyces sp. 8N706 TaxID=3457416 RepID=UPI003FD3D733